MHNRQDWPGSPAAAPKMRPVKPDLFPMYPGQGAYATAPTMDGRTMQTCLSAIVGLRTLRSVRAFPRKYLHRHKAGRQWMCLSGLQPRQQTQYTAEGELMPGML